jgi:hypothetical protein
LVTVGHHYIKSLSTVHHAENEVGVSYRYRKSFSGRVIRFDNSADMTVSFYVRDLDTCDHSSLTLAGDAHFRRLGLVSTCPLGGLTRPLLAHKLNLAAAHCEMVTDLRSETWRYVDYFGKSRENTGVVTSTLANRLYVDELASLKG